ncbi:MAG: EamA family transporter [Elusimicrobia bacterium]|nr:EamA family transporter [Elusimicrobiota bacterium]
MTERGRANAALAAVCVAWGTTYLAIKTGVREVPPVLFNGSRFFAAGVLLTIFVLAAGRRRPRPAELWPLAVAAVLMMAVANSVLSWALQRVPSGVASLLVALVPLWMVVLATLYGERVSPRGWAGVAVGLAGLVVLLWPELRAARSRPGLLAGALSLCGSTGVWAWASLYAKRHPVRADHFAALAFEKIVGGAAAVVFALALGERAPAHPSRAAAGAFVYLIVVGSMIGYSCYLYALARLPTERVAMYAYANPVIAVTLGALFGGERLGPHELAGAGVVLTGVYLASTGARAAPRAEAERGAVESAL